MDGYACLNRTFMELKLNNTDEDTGNAGSLNRTFMELKQDYYVWGNKDHNSTFMELKRFKQKQTMIVRTVLIVPLWN